MIKPIPVLLSEREVAIALSITRPRIQRAILKGVLRPDAIANAAYLFSPRKVKRIARIFK